MGEDDEPLVPIRGMIDSALSKVHTCCPGIIDRFDAEHQTVTVKPAVKKLLFLGNQEAEWLDVPVLVDVPLIVLSGKGYALTFPIESGDECLLFFAERSLDNWHEQGGTGEQTSTRMHSLSDAFALVGVRSRPHKITNYNADEVELRSADGKTRVRIHEQGQIHLDQGDNHIAMTQNEIKLTASQITVDGKLVVSGSVEGHSGASFSGDVNGSGISLAHHTHGGVSGGGSVTGPPQ